MIIVEGLDNSGKTTLINKLLEWFPELKLQPKSVGADGTGKDLMGYMVQFLAQPPADTKNLLFDRFPLFSEAVYGPILRGGMAIMSDLYQQATQQLRYHEPLIIHCQIPLHKVEETFTARQQMKGVKEHLLEINKAYQELMFKARLMDFKVQYYDWTTMTDAHIKLQVGFYLRKGANRG